MAAETDKSRVKLPKGNQAATVRLINPVNFGPAIISRFMAPAVPGLETFPSSPCFSFLVENEASGRKIVFDLGIRKDFATGYAPGICEYIKTTNYKIEVEKNVVEILQDGGVNPQDVEAVIWSHWHWDHIGDPGSFSSSTALVVGPGFKDKMLPGAPKNPNSPIQEKDYAGRELREIEFDSSDRGFKIGSFPAYDYFGDGSFYLLDSPGHAVGHLCGLARTTTSPATFVLLGGDVCHYAGIFRPSPQLPMAETIQPHPCASSALPALCPGHAWEELQASRGRKSTEPLYDMTFGHDIPLASKTREWLQDLDCLDDVFVIVAHDSTVRDGGIPQFPASLNEWKEKGWGKKVRWAFLRDLETYWKSKSLA